MQMLAAELPANPADLREARFAELVRAQRDRAVALAYHLVGGDRGMAEDVAQEALVRAYRGLASFRDEAALSTWFLRIVINQAATCRRRRWLRDKLGLGLGRTEEESAATAAADPGLRRRLAAALDVLSASQREAFALIHLEELTVVEAAAVMNKPVGTVKSHLHRALVTLRRELGDLREVE